jgi:predicted Zn-dependent peptidase
MPSTAVEKRVLPNGLTLLTKPSQANDIVAVTVMLGIGSIRETDAQAGLSNLTQTLLLKGTASRTAEQIAVELESTGARVSASAARDYGVISLIATADGLPASLPILFDVLRNPSFPADQVAHEVAQTLQKIRAKEDQFMQKAVELLAEAYYGTHPYHKPLLGYPETVPALTREDVAGFFNAYYRPDSTILSVAGHFDRAWVVEQVEAHLGGATPAPPPPFEVPAMTPLTEPRQRVEPRESQATWLALGFGAPSITDADHPAMEVLDTVLGGSMNCRLFTELRDRRGLAYQVGSTYIARPGPSVFVAYIGAGPDQFEVAREGILDELRKVRSEPVSDEELRASKTYIKGTFVMGQERNSSQASMLARFESVGLGHGYAQRYPGLIDRVTAEDVLRVARTHLGDAYALGAVVPKERETADRVVERDLNGSVWLGGNVKRET